MKFELFGKLKGDKKKKKEQKSSQRQRRSERSGEGNLPMDEVRRLSQQGYSEDEMVNQLRDNGYNYPEIKKAMNQVLKAQTQGEARGPSGRRPQEGSPSRGGSGRRGPEPLSAYQGKPQSGGTPRGSEQQPGEINQPPAEDYGGEGVPEDTEELIEVMISEKLIDIEDEFERVHSHIENLQEKTKDLEDRIKEIEIRKDEQENKFLSKVNEMEDYLETSQSRIGGLEKALQQVLPSLVDNVRELTSLVQDMKKEEKY